MAGIVPIPTTRVGDLFIRQRLTTQAQRDQLDLFRLQTAISSGQRIQLPSEDAAAALRAINLQRLIERKDQIASNLRASDKYLSGADSRLRSVSDALVELRGAVVSVSGNVVTDSAREAVRQNVDSLLQELVNAGNAKMGGRYLFAGSRAQAAPYSFDGAFVEYTGNEGVLRSYVDLERLFDTNMAGTDVFGGISAAVEGSVDLNPQVSANTLVSTLNNGNGIGKNPAITLSVNNGTTTQSAVIDLGTAVTVGDVAALIETNSPAGTNVSVEVTSTGLIIHGGTDTVTIAEVAEGRSARFLGIYTDPTVPSSITITGQDLNPALLKTTRLDDLLGTKAQGVIELSGPNNDLQLTAAVNGTSFNGLNVVFQSGVTAGSETAVFNSGTNTLTVTLQDGVSTADQVAAAISAEGTFTATTDYGDAFSSIQAGTGALDLGSSPPLSFTNVTSGGGGDVLDTANGLHLSNGGESVALNISSATTVEDLLNLINGAEIGLLAEINAAGDGINVRSRISGADFSIGENGGTTATQLGIRTYTGDTELASLNHGTGVSTTAALETLDATKLDELRIVARDGGVLTVDLTGATTLQDIAALINGDVDNNVGTTSVLARLTPGGNGLELVDSSSSATGRLQVEVPPGSEAAEYLGFVPVGATQKASTTSDTSGNDLLGGKKLLGNDFVILARNGTQLSVDLAGATTVQHVIDRINSNADNVPPIITAQLARVGNGIELIDSSAGTGTLVVRTAEGSIAAQHLGFVAAGQSESDAADVQVEGANLVLQSEDRNPLETDSVFNTLVRLRTALAENDVDEIGRTLERLDTDMSRLNFARAEIGGRLQNLDVIGVRIQDEHVQLKSALSEDIDVDLVEAISQMTARQYAFEASLRSTASLMQLSLLNFL